MCCRHLANLCFRLVGVAGAIGLQLMRVVRAMAWMGSVISCGFGWSGVVEMVDVGMTTLPPWDWDGAAAAVE